MDRRTWQLAEDRQREARRWAEDERLADSAREANGIPAKGTRTLTVIGLLFIAMLILGAVIALNTGVVTSAEGASVQVRGLTLDAPHTSTQLLARVLNLIRMNDRDSVGQATRIDSYPRLVEGGLTIRYRVGNGYRW